MIDPNNRNSLDLAHSNMITRVSYTPDGGSFFPHPAIDKNPIILWDLEERAVNGNEL
jgi:hypothetical protein